jgi:sulfhydrogenase subunit gamma (sulfur reductase)
MQSGYKMANTSSENKGFLYAPRDAEIVSVSDLTPDEKLFSLRMKDGSDLNHLPGQFVQLSILGFTEAPISVASSPTRKGLFDLAIRRAGTLTAEMHRKVVGDTVGIRGPFGSSFELSLLRGKDLLLISGGCGLAPLRSLIQYCYDRPEEFGRLEIIYGARNPDMLLFKADLQKWKSSAVFGCSITVDDVKEGVCFEGSVGLITTLIPGLDMDPDRACAVVVGPPPMFRAVIEELKKKGFTADQIILSLERNMRCGVGKCGHCSIEHLYCCTDGPVFRLDQVEGVRGAI